MTQAFGLWTRLLPKSNLWLQVRDSIRPTEEEAEGLRRTKHPQAVVIPGEEEYLCHQHVFTEDEVAALTKANRQQEGR